MFSINNLSLCFTKATRKRSLYFETVILKHAVRYLPDMKWSPQTLTNSPGSAARSSLSNPREPSRSTFDAQSLFFYIRSLHDRGKTVIAFVLFSVRTIGAAKNRTEVHHNANKSTIFSTRFSDTRAICLQACPPVRKGT